MDLSDGGDRGDRGRRRRRRGGRKEREREKEPTPQPTKPPIILAKPPVERTGSDAASSPSKLIEKPQLVLKTRDDQRPLVSTSPNVAPSIPSILAGESIPQPTYQIQRNPSVSSPAPIMIEGSSQARLAPPPEMVQSMKLVDDSMLWCDSGMEMLLDQTDFLTVGILGSQGTGKSTILSLLAGNSIDEPTKSFVFRPQSKETREVGGHQTVGIDMYVTGERLILLDSQPVLSASVLDHMIHHDKKYSTEYITAENCVEIQSLQMATFMLTVCNVVIIAQDWFADINLLRFLQTAEMLKPATPSPSHESGSSIDDSPEYYPHIVFAYNKGTRADFSVDNFCTVQTTLARIMDQSKLRYKGGVSMTYGNLIPGLTKQRVNEEVNMFILPSFDSETQNTDVVSFLLPEYRGYPSFHLLFKSLRNQLFALPRCPLTHTSLSEKNWFHYAARTWEAVKKSSLLSEYNRLLP